MVSNNLLAGLMVITIMISIAGAGVTLNILGTMPAITGIVVGTTNATVEAATTITLPTSTIDFGDINVSSGNDTEDMSPPPIIVQNDGSVKVDITIGATDLWTGTGGANPSGNYKFNSTENETGSVSNATLDLTTTWVNMPASASPTNFANNTDYNNSHDALYCHIEITVPDDEASGAKSSTITFIATQA